MYTNTAAYVEDKKCRMCGIADLDNINIFAPGYNYRTLATKINTVYPIVVYQNDPLPKNICKKCIYNVTFIYNDIQRVLKMQAKWITNVRSIQPNHNYIKVLDLIESSNSVTRQSVKSTFGEDICELSINRKLLGMNAEIKTKKRRSSKKKPVTTEVTKATAVNEPSAKPDVVTANEPDAEGKTAAIPEKSNKINYIKSKLELNGCTLLSVPTKKQPTLEAAPHSVAVADDQDDDRDRDGDANGDDIKLFNNSEGTQATAADMRCSSEEPKVKVKCRYCPLNFESLNSLANHQLIHMQLRIPKIFEKKFLPKDGRRGRIVSVCDRKCIRCLNCWRIFRDNDSILDHWSLGECDFYCHLCGKEYPHTPKMLREHVPAAHGINYRSSKLHRPRMIPSMYETKIDCELYQSVTEQEPKPSEESPTQTDINKPTLLPEQKNVTCEVCYQVFQNFKARNSHMRKHKPPFDYNDVIFPPNYDVKPDGQETTANKTTPPEKSKIPKRDAKLLLSQLPPPNDTSRNDPAQNTVRGVRTKFVNRRNDVNIQARIKVKSIQDLQSPATANTSITASVAVRNNVNVSPSSTPSTSLNDVQMGCVVMDEPICEIKEEPMDLDVSIWN